MKRIKILFLCMALALCTIGIVGCGNDDNNGSSQSGTGTEQNGTSGNRETNSETKNNNNKETATSSNNGNNSGTTNKESSGGNGVMDDLEDTVETIVDDAATAVDDLVR